MVVLTRSPHSNLLFDHPAPKPVEPLRPVPHAAEAPDRGEREREAPESWVLHRAEAPDLGEGRTTLLEHEFTRGRSQS